MTSESAELPRDPVYLLYLGRPLWGALLQQPGEDTAAVLSATNTKMYRGRMRSPAISIAEALALLSYRVNFYVGVPALTDTLTTHYLQYIVSVD